MSGLSNHALLMSLNISQWTARKRDKQETSALAARHGTAESVASVNKSLLPMAHSLDRIHKLSGAIRTEFYRTTLPWGEGQGILKADAYLTIAPRFADLKNEWYDTVEHFLRDYPILQQDAKVFLNTMYKDEDYPDVEQLRSKFSVDIAFSTLPDPNDCRKIASLTGFADEMAEQIAKQYSSREQSAMKEAWQRLYDTVSKTHERLSDPKNVFRNSLIDNARDLCSVLPSLNISNDANLETLRRDLEQSLCKYQPDHLRDDEVLREEVSDKMADIMSKMGAFYNA